MCPWGQLDLARELRSLEFAVRVVVFCCGRWVYSRATKVSLGSSSDVGFTRRRPRGRCVHLVAVFS